jgi:hypothetical protein
MTGEVLRRLAAPGTLAAAEDMLRHVAPGQAFHVPYEVFADLFPPGLPDDGAKEAARRWAQAKGLEIENRPDRAEVLFVRPASKG